VDAGGDGTVAWVVEADEDRTCGVEDRLKEYGEGAQADVDAAVGSVDDIAGKGIGKDQGYAEDEKGDEGLK